MLITQNDYICGKNWQKKFAKYCTSELAKFGHPLGETELTKPWQKVRSKFGQTESSVDHYIWHIIYAYHKKYQMSCHFN